MFAAEEYFHGHLDWYNFDLVPDLGVLGEPAESPEPPAPFTLTMLPLEEVLLSRDEMANMVWAIERTIALPSGDPKRGREAANETPPIRNGSASTRRTCAAGL